MSVHIQEDILSPPPEEKTTPSLPTQPEVSTGGSESAFEPLEESEEVEEFEEVGEESEEESAAPEVEAPSPIPEYVGTILQEIGELKQKVAQPAQAQPAVEDINVLIQQYPDIAQDASAYYEDVLEREIDRRVLREGGYENITTDELAQIELESKQKASVKSRQFFDREVRREMKLEKVLQLSTPPDPGLKKVEAISSIVPEVAQAYQMINSKQSFSKAEVQQILNSATQGIYNKAYGETPTPTAKQPTTPPAAPKYKPPKSGQKARSSGAIQAKDEHLALAQKMFPMNYNTPEKAARTEKHIIETMKRRGS